MKILVTGGAGYIGAVLCERLLTHGHQVRVLDRLYWGRKPLERLLDRIELVQADVRNMDDGLLDGIDGVVHLAGLSNDPTAEYNPEANWEMNAVATERLALACRRRGITRFTFGSSASIYDGLGDGIFDESTKVAPRGAYSRSKFAAEQALLREADRNFAPVILRQGTVYGYSPRMRLDLVVNTFIKDALLRGKLFLHGGGWMWRPLVDIGDVAETHLRCLEAPAGSLQAAQMGLGDVTDVDERPPHPAAAMQKQLPAQQRIFDEGVHHEIQPHARAVPIHRPLAQDHRGKVPIGLAQQRLFGGKLGAGVSPARRHLGALVEDAVTEAVVDRGTRTECEARDAAAPAGERQSFGGDRVHLPVGLGVVFCSRIVRKPSQVHHAVDAVQQPIIHVANVSLHELDAIEQPLQRFAAPIQAIQDADLMSAREQPLAEHGADIPRATGDQNFHGKI